MPLSKDQLQKAEKYFSNQTTNNSYNSKIKTVGDYYNAQNKKLDEEGNISSISGNFIDNIKNRYKQKGLLGGTSENINAAYEGYKDLPIIKQARQIGGGVVGTAGKVIGGVVGGLGQLGYNAVTGKPLTEGVVDEAKRNSEDTGKFGYNIGSEGTAAAPLGLAGKIPNALMAGSQIYEGATGIKEAKNAEDYINSGLQIGVGLLGAKSAKTGKGNFFNAEMTTPLKNAVIEKVPSAKYAVKPIETIVKPGIKNTKKLISKTGDKIGDSLSPIEKNVQTELTKSSIPKEQRIENYDRYINQAEKAKVDNSQSTPLELAGGRGEEALKKLKEQLTAAGQKKEVALQEHGAKIVKTQPSFQKFGEMLEKRLGTTIDENNNFIDAKGRKSLVINSTSDKKLVTKVFDTLRDLGTKPTLQEVNDAIDGIQGELFKGKTVGAEPISGKTESVIKEVITDLNNNAKNVGGDIYKQANAEYSTKREIYDTLNKALGIEGNKGAALMKQLFSPSGTMPRKLFTAIKEATGIDLVHESTLAKFAMESVGDARQASLLNEVLRGNVPLSKGGVVGKALEYGVNKLQNPIKRARRIIEKSK